MRAPLSRVSYGLHRSPREYPLSSGALPCYVWSPSNVVLPSRTALTTVTVYRLALTASPGLHPPGANPTSSQSCGGWVLRAKPPMVIVVIVATAAVVVSSPVPVLGLAVPTAGGFSTQTSHGISPLGRLLLICPRRAACTLVSALGVPTLLRSA